MKVVEYFAGKNLFITGGSGFLGKVLIEKLLRTCNDIGNIYILLRAKKGKTIEERLKYIKSLPLFDTLRESNPEAFSKLIPINGDVLDLNLGLSDEDRQLIINNVNIIYHTAASVKFDDPLKHAILVNVRSTRDVVNLASETKHLSMFVHVSTAYCNCDKLVVDEVLYPAPGDWRSAIDMAENMDESLVECFSEKYIKPLPNTYTYAKALGEHVVNDLCKGKIPAVIVRPTVVISAIHDPLPGWLDNFNGPVGLLVAGGKGILRTVLGDEDSIQDFIPVDTVANVLIMTTKTEAVKGDINKVEIYHASKHKHCPLTTGKMIDMGAKLVWDSPFTEILWYPRFKMTKCWYDYYIKVILFHMLPAFFVDLLLRIIGRKPMLFNIQRKVYIANVVLEYFTRHTWTFINRRSMSLLEELTDDELPIFGLNNGIANLTEEEIFDYFRNGKIFGACFILKEKFDFSRVKSRKNLYKLWVIDIVTKTLFLFLASWILFVKLDILTNVCSSVRNYFENL